MNLLFDDRLAPITSEIGFLEADYTAAAQAFVDWLSPLEEPYGFAFRQRPVAGSLEDVLQTLLPLTDTDRLRSLFVPTRGQWTAFFDNLWRGTDTGAVGVIATKLRCRGLRVAAIPNTIRNPGKGRWKGRYGAMILEIYDSANPNLDVVRSIAAVNDGGRWVFHQFGEPLPFEEVSRYTARRIKDRFTFDMLQSYLRALGLDPFEESFYLPPPKKTAILVEKVGTPFPGMSEYTLAEARADL